MLATLIGSRKSDSKKTGSKNVILTEIRPVSNGVQFEKILSRGSPQTNENPTSHPAVCALKICISSKRLRSEVRKKALLEIQ